MENSSKISSRAKNVVLPSAVGPWEQNVFPRANFWGFFNLRDEEIFIPENHGPFGNQISTWPMWKSDFFSLVQPTISRIFLKGMEIYQWPSHIVTHTGISILSSLPLLFIIYYLTVSFSSKERKSQHCKNVLYQRWNFAQAKFPDLCT